MAGSQAVRVADFTNSIGINTHIDFTWTAYSNLQRVETALNYIGVKNVRDSINNPADIGANGWWQQVANATGVKFDAFIGSGSPSGMTTGLNYIKQAAPQHIFNYIEGGNEEDNSYAVSQGNSAQIAAQFQQQVYSVGQSLGLPVINISFGAGWGTNPTQGDYATVGNISAYSNYANGHTYYGTGNPPSYNINWVNSLAQISSNHPVITTETGWYTTGVKTDSTSVSESVQAKYMLDALLDAYKAGDVKTYLYELLDQKTGDGYSEDNFGLFHSDGTPKAAATALHNLTTLLADTGTNSTSFAPGTLSYSLSGMQSTDNSMLMEKSDGTYWLSIWNETRLSSATSSTDIAVPNHTVTLTLGSQASAIKVFDPMTGTTSVQTVNNATTAQISVPDHPVLVEIIPSGTTGTGGTGTGTGGTGTGTGGTGTGTGGTDTSGTGTLSSNDLALTVPTSASATTNGSVAVAASISDPWAASHSGTMALNVTVTGGTLTMTDSNGNAVAGSGTNAIHISGTLSQLNADLAHLTYNASATAGTQSLMVDVWNQAGVEATKYTSIGVTAGSTGGTTGGTGTGTGGTGTGTGGTGTDTGGTGTGTGTLSSNDTSIVIPATVDLFHGSTAQVTGISVSDPWAASHSGTMALNVTAAKGTISMTDINGQAVAGSGSHAIHLSGTLDQINADLATLSYHASTTIGADAISVNVWNQAGVSTTKNIIANSTLTGNIQGTAGNDILSGTVGSTLTGNGGADTFYYQPGNTGNRTTANHITDFSLASGHKIDLHGFGLTASDFNSTGTLSGSKSITFLQGTDNSNHAVTTVMIDTVGDHFPHYEIQVAGQVALHASDFTFA